jgi:hypothetical protein
MMLNRPRQLNFIRISLIVLSVAAAACSRKPTGPVEAVLTKGMSVTATNPNGTVTITAGEGWTRTFSGQDWSATRELSPRPTRWNGSLGLYDPASSFSPYGRVLVEEGQLFFSSESEFLRHLYSGSAIVRPVYTHDGLVFAYNVAPVPSGEPARSVELWQAYINGRKPTSLKGSNDSAFSVSGGTTPETSSPHPAPVGSVR